MSHHRVQTHQDLTKRQLPQNYNVDVQNFIAKQRQLLCEGDLLQKKSRNAGLFNKYQKRFVWITPQGKDALKVMYWCNIKNLKSERKIVTSHDNLRKIAVEKKHFIELKNISTIKESLNDKDQFDIVTKTGLLIQFKTLDQHAKRSEWVSALKACKKGDLIYLLEFSTEDITSEVKIKDRMSGEWETCVVVDYVVSEEQTKNNEPGYHVLAKENGMKFVYFKVDLLRTKYKMERGKNKSFAHERESREVENYKRMRAKERRKIRNSIVGPTPRLSIAYTAPRPPSNSVLNMPPPPLPAETQDVPERKTVTKTTIVTTTTNVEVIKELRLIISRQQELIDMQEEEEQEHDKKLQKYADQIKDKDEEIEFLKQYKERARDPDTVEKRLKMLEQDVDELKRQLERAYRDAEKWRKEAERLREQMDAEVAKKHEGTNMHPPPRSRPPADQDKWAHYLLLFPPPSNEDESDDQQSQPVTPLPPMEEEQEEKKSEDDNFKLATVNSTEENNRIDELLAELEKEKESRRTVEAALRLANQARNSDDDSYRLEFEHKEEELKEQVKTLKKSRSVLRIQLNDALKIADAEKEEALKKFAAEHEKLEEAENEKVRLQVEMMESSLQTSKLQKELFDLNKKIADSDEKVQVDLLAEKKMNDEKLSAVEVENEKLRAERSNLVLRLLDTQKQNAKQKDELAVILRLEKSAHAKDQEHVKEMEAKLEAKLAQELAEQRQAEASTEDLLHRLDAEKTQRLQLEAELAAVRKAQFEHEGEMKRTAEEKEKELLSQQETLKTQRSVLRLELNNRLQAVEEEKESTDEELKRVQQAHIIALRDFELEHSKLEESEKTIENLRQKMEESKAKESVMETQIMALRARLEDKSQLSEKEHDLLKEEHNNNVSKLLLQREEINSQKEQLATLLMLEKTAHQRDVESASVELEDLTSQLRNEELIIEQLKDLLKKQEENYEVMKTEEVKSLKKEITVQVTFCQKLQHKITFLNEKEEKARINAEAEKAKSESEIQYLQDELAEISKKLADANDQHAKTKSVAISSHAQVEEERIKLLQEFATLHDQHAHLSNQLVLEQNKLVAIKERDASLLARTHKLEKELKEKSDAEEESKKVRDQLESNLANEMVLNDKLRAELWTALHDKETNKKLTEEEIELAKKREKVLKSDLEESTDLLKNIRKELETQLHEVRVKREEEKKLAQVKKEELLLEVKREKEQQQNLAKHLEQLKNQLEHEKSVEKAIKFDHHLTKNQLKRETAAVEKLLTTIRELKTQQKNDLEIRKRMSLEIAYVNKLKNELEILVKHQENEINQANLEKKKEIEILKAKITISNNVIQSFKYDLNSLEQKIKEELLQKELLQNRIIELENSEKLGSEEIERQNIMLDKSEKSNAKLIHMLEMNKRNYHQELDDVRYQLQKCEKKLEQFRARNKELNVENQKNKAIRKELEESFNKSDYEISLVRTKLEMSINLIEELRYSNDQLRNELEQERALSFDLERRLKLLEAKSKADNQKLHTEILNLREQLKVAKQSIDTCNNKIALYQQESKENNHLRQKLEILIKNHNENGEKSNQELQSLQRKLVISKNVISELRGSEKEFINQVNDKNNKLRNLQKDLEEARNSAKQVKITLGRQLNNERETYERKLREEQESHVIDVEKIETKKVELQKQLEEGKGIQDMLNRRIEILEEEVRNQKLSANLLQVKRDEIEEKLQKEVDINTKIRERLNELTEKSITKENRTTEEVAKLIEEKDELEQKLKSSNIKVELMQNNLREQLEAEKQAHKDDLEEDRKRKAALKQSLESSESIRRDLSNKLHEKEEYIEKVESEALKFKTEAHQMEVAQQKLIEYLQNELKKAEEHLKKCGCHGKETLRNTSSEEEKLFQKITNKTAKNKSGRHTVKTEEKVVVLKVLQKKDEKFTVNAGKKKRVKQSGRKIKKVVFSGGQGTAKGIDYYRGQW